MRRCTRTRTHPYLYSTLLPKEFSDDLRSLKEASGLTWDGLADYLGVDARQLQRWRSGTKPSGEGMYALLQLAAQVPGAAGMILKRDVVLLAGPFQPAGSASDAGRVRG